jgi:hypothetical protein
MNSSAARSSPLCCALSRHGSFRCARVFPVILNIAALTNSVGFVGTKYITILMLLACTYLLAWEYDRLKPLVSRARQPRRIAEVRFSVASFAVRHSAARRSPAFRYASVANIIEDSFRFCSSQSSADSSSRNCSAHYKFMNGAIDCFAR